MRYYEFSIGEINPKRQTLSWFTQSGQAVLPITNHSDREILFRVEGSDEEGTCNFEFIAPGENVSLAKRIELRLEPDETVLLPVRITPRTRRLVSLGRQTHFCVITTAMLGERPRQQSVLTKVQSAPLVGPGLAVLLSICLVVLASLLVGRIATSLAVADGRRQAAQRTAPLTASGGHSSEKVSPPVSVEKAASGVTAGQVTYEEMFKEVAQQYDLDWRLLAEQAYRESCLNYLALGDAHELGLMQILPSTWNEWAPEVGVTDPWDPYSNVLVAAAYLSFLREYLSEMGYPQDYWMLVAYNWGPNNLYQLFESGGGWAQVPAVTRQYTLDILKASETGAVSAVVFDGIQESVTVRSIRPERNSEARFSDAPQAKP